MLNNSLYTRIKLNPKERAIENVLLIDHLCVFSQAPPHLFQKKVLARGVTLLHPEPKNNPTDSYNFYITKYSVILSHCRFLHST